MFSCTRIDGRTILADAVKTILDLAVAGLLDLAGYIGVFVVEDFGGS